MEIRVSGLVVKKRTELRHELASACAVEGCLREIQSMMGTGACNEYPFANDIFVTDWACDA